MDYLKQLQQVSQPYQEIINLQIQLAEIQRCCQELAAGQLLSRPLPLLQLTEDDWWAFLTIADRQGIAPAQAQRDYRQLQHLLRNFRKYLQYHDGQWTLISQQALRVWTKYWPFRRYLELMAGDGRLARGLAARGQAVIATDSLAWQSENETGRQQFFPVRQLGAREAVQKIGPQVDAIILAWSPNNDPLDWFLWQQIAQLPNHPDLIVIGEKFGVTNSELFWRTVPAQFAAPLVKLRRFLPATIDGVQESVYLYRSTAKGGWNK
ncbi:hypothetical protein [Lapidilactobacillus wuchangensis]|uniref:hypothetical protein n=1 Tax=Lapidilactobacillus wuchangensis TaxID=2486001 RepID=UPI000F78DF03|nr:hypothetical protein [Lapidilactobacillus wuchangensis]